MDIFHDLGKTIEKVARQVGEKSEEVLESGKLNIEILKQEDAIRKLNRKIGEHVSAQYSKGQTFDEHTNALCLEIEEKKKKIEELRVKLGELKKSGKQSANKTDNQTDQLSEEQKQQQILRTSECSPNGPGMTFDDTSANMDNNKHSK